MRIKSFFNSLFDHTDDPMPSSLGKNKNHLASNLDSNIQLPKQTTSAETSEEENKATVDYTFNLIILDESGSMYDVRNKTIDGCNETLAGIRNTAKEQPDTKQFVSIFCFDTTNSRYIFKNMPIEKTRDLTREDYLPNSCTPLYDAIGYTVTQLRQLIDETEYVGVVTIITDGYENASNQWNHSSVVELIDSLKKKGWVFTFIGANIDVERTARGLGIDSHITFEQTDEGMDKMFEQEKRARRAYNEKMYYMKHRPMYDRMSCDERRETMSSMNANFFIEDERIAPNIITELEENEIFVFGSNIIGRHNGGAALHAKQHYGAIEGLSEGIQGQSYAIPTTVNTFDELKKAVVRFTDYVVTHPQNKFMLTAIGCGNAGYDVSQIAPLFRQAYSFGNVYVPAAFLRYLVS